MKEDGLELTFLSVAMFKSSFFNLLSLNEGVRSSGSAEEGTAQVWAHLCAPTSPSVRQGYLPGEGKALNSSQD